MRFRSLLAALSLGLAAFVSSASAANYSGSYSENFDELGTTGTAAPAGWSVYNLTGSHDTFRFANSNASITTTFLPNANSTAILVGSGTSTAISVPTLTATNLTSTSSAKGVAGYNFASSTSTSDRSLGSSPSGNSAATEFQLQLTNVTSGAISGLDIGYDMDRFTTTGSNNSGYTLTPGLEELPGYWLFYSLDNGSTWTNVSSLNPTLDGAGGTIAMPNSVGVTTVPSTEFNPSSAWTPGSILDLRWVDDNAQSPSPDQLIGLNNVTVQTDPVPEPGTYALGLVALILVVPGLRFLPGPAAREA